MEFYSIKIYQPDGKLIHNFSPPALGKSQKTFLLIRQISLADCSVLLVLIRDTAQNSDYKTLILKFICMRLLLKPNFANINENFIKMKINK